MDIRELRYFAAVFSERNLTAAAKRCFISQPSISAAITNLEAELGTTLFIRHKKGMAPTASAEQFHAVARRLIDDADAAKNLFRKPSTRRQLTLGLMRTLDMPRTIALLKPLTGTADVALRLVGIKEKADARIIAKNIMAAKGIIELRYAGNPRAGDADTLQPQAGLNREVGSKPVT